MHRDTKLGLALAILVMGFAAALCFPRETRESEVDLTLQSGSELDSVIRLKQVKTYTDADRPKPRVTERTLPAVAPAEVVDESPGQPLAANVPDAIPSTAPVEPTPIEPASVPADVIESVEPEPVIPTRTYTVRPLDTLSGIAKQEMGSVGKWSMLFDANRDQLQNPNDLAPGMVLVIPIPDDDMVLPSASESTPVVVSPPSGPVRGTPERPESVLNRPSGRFSRPTKIGAGATPPRLN